MPPLADTVRERFALEVYRGKSAGEAAKVVGYAERTGNNLIKQPDIQRRITELQNSLAAKVTYDKQFVIEKLAQAVRIAFGEDTVKLKKTTFGFTVETEQNTLDLPAGIRALELLGKEYGMFKDKSEVEINVIHLISDKPMTPETWEQAYANHARLTASDAE